MAVYDSVEPLTPLRPPPAYQAHSQLAAPDPNEILDPCTLVLRGRFIYPVTDSFPDGRCGHDTGTRACTRPPDGSPVVSRRAKDAYRLEHRKPMPLMGIPAEIWLEPLTRKALGTIRIERSPRLPLRIRALQHRDVKVKKGEYWFAVKGGKDDCWEWSDDQGMVVAQQLREDGAPADADTDANAGPGSDNGAGAGGAGADATAEQREDVYSLRVVEPLSRRQRDSLVALWCLWMWHHHIEEITPKKTWEDRKRILHKPRQAVSSWYL
ncbi:uncharacterized protein P884DRAFT_333050 [Thermothelomyces heterothallicus CBS 202.75]|uniref:uncharacterized protein n=1 Tax=Thermothelomyces heterothallicus CBS 202.75 TaxID=1149848 RepID=UPI003743790A